MILVCSDTFQRVVFKDESDQRAAFLAFPWRSPLTKVRDMLFLIVSVSMAALEPVNIHTYVMIRLE